MLELWKPLITLKDSSDPIIFNDAAVKYSVAATQAFDNHPFVIFYDDIEKNYYYISTRSAKDKSGNIKRKFKGEILINGTGQRHSLLSKDSYVDCSKIYKINSSVLESIIDKNDIKYIQTKQLEQSYIYAILKEINQCVNEIPPYLSILEVYKDKGKMDADSVYLCESKYERLKDMVEQDIIVLKERNEINDFAPTEEKLQEAYKFKAMFQEEYKKELNLINKDGKKQMNESEEDFESKKSKSKMSL